jgi:hypothetical protein
MSCATTSALDHCVPHKKKCSHTLFLMQLSMAACVCYHSITASFRYLLWCLKLSRHTYIVVVTCDGSPVVKASISANLAYLFFRSCHRNWSYQSLVCVTNCLVGHSNDNFVGVFCVWWSWSRAWGEVIAMTLGGYLHDEFLFTGVWMFVSVARQDRVFPRDYHIPQ